MAEIGAHLRAIIGTGEDVTLPGGARITVRPFTLDELSEMDRLEPGDLTSLEYMRLKVWMILRNVPGWESTWPEFKAAVDSEAWGSLAALREAISRQNAKFRYRLA